MSELPSLPEIARALHGEVQGDKVLAPGPGHSTADRSLLVRLSQEASDGFFVHSFTDDDAIACKDYVRTQLGLPPFKPAPAKIEFDFRDPETGSFRYRKIRCEKADGTKTFYFEKPSRNGGPPLLYGGEDVADLEEDRPVWIVEGEKKVEALRQRGQVAVSGDTGAKSKWRPEHVQLLANRRIIFWPDSDPDGEKYLNNAATAIRAENPDADLRVVRPFPLNGSKGKDVCDWTGGAEELAALVEGATPFECITQTKAAAETEAAPPHDGAGHDADPIPVPVWEAALAHEFIRRHGHEFRYVDQWGRWMRWTDVYWEHEATRLVHDLNARICRDSAQWFKDNSKPPPKDLGKFRTVSAVEMYARHERTAAAAVEQWDKDELLLNTAGGAVVFPNGGRHQMNVEIRPNRPSDYCTKITGCGPAEPGTPCPLWLGFLNTVMGSDAELVAYLQRVCGYCLTGSIREHALFFLYGTGGNGKGVFINTIRGIMGTYHTTAPIDTFTVTNSTSHPTDLAGLRGARLVTAVETEEGRRWSESKIKALTGGDEISARFMRQDFFTYTPTFKLMIAGNHKPRIRTVDEAMRRRIQMIPFNVTIAKENRDPDLAGKLKAEWPAILRWMIDGCLMWKRDGLAPPAAVIDATNQYLEAEDTGASWITEKCDLGKDKRAASALLFASFKAWAEKNGEFVGTQRGLIDKLLLRPGVERTPDKNLRGLQGIGLKPETEPETRPPDGDEWRGYR